MERLKSEEVGFTWNGDENVLMSAAAEHNNTDMVKFLVTKQNCGSTCR